MTHLYFRFANTLVFVFAILSLNAQIKIIPYQQLQSTSGMYFGASMSASTITVTFSGPSTRWIALGFGTSMNNCDALVYSNGQSSALHALGWNDYYCLNTSASNVTNDAVQNWTITSNTVASGQRTVVASRALNTGDSNDAIITYSANALNIVWARSASADYTLAYHGSGNRGFGISLPWLSQPVAGFTVNTNTVCVGSSITFSNTSTGGQNTYAWTLPGTNLSVSSATNPVASYTAPGTYSVALTASNAVGTDTYTQLNYITVIPLVVPSVTVSQTAGSNPVCSGVPVTFSASTINGGTTPSFQWKVNGVNSGSNSSVFTSTSLPNPAVVSLVLTSNATCASPTTASNVAVTLTVNSSAPAGVGINLTGGTNPLCSGSTLTFSATPVNGGAAPVYQWKINNVAVGANSPTYSTNSIANGNVVTCEIVSSSTCAVTTTAVSSGITLTVSSVLVPSVNINMSSGSNPLCAGSIVTFSAIAGNGGSTPSFQWKINGVNSGSNSPVFTSSTLTNGAVVTCVMTSNSSCSSPNTATSSAISVTVNAIPSAPVISPNGTVNLCSGKNLTLISSSGNGNNWSTGATTPSIVVSNSGTFWVTQTQNGCVSPQSAVVTVSMIPTPVVSMTAATAVCKDDAPLVLLGNPAGGVFSGNAVNGSNFSPQVAGNGTFVVKYVYTATNTCSDSSNVSIVVSECAGLEKNSTRPDLFSIYPNPSRSQFVVSAPGHAIHNIKVLDLTGKLIMKDTVNGPEVYTLNMVTTKPGVYFIEITIDNFISRSRIIVSE